MFWLKWACLSSVPGGPVGTVSADSGAAGIRGDAAENQSDRSADIEVMKASVLKSFCKF